MLKRNILNKGFVKALLLACFVTIFLVGCIPNNQYQPVAKTKKPGIYNVKGWNYAPCSFFNKNALGNCTSKDIDGKVGYPLYVEGLRANCVPSGKWKISKKIITSGTFPPGISFDGNRSAIKGIPEKRGHWIVRLKVEYLYCNDKSFWGLEQELRFHITGSGKVNQ